MPLLQPSNTVDLLSIAGRIVSANQILLFHSSSISTRRRKMRADAVRAFADRAGATLMGIAASILKRLRLAKILRGNSFPVVMGENVVPWLILKARPKGIEVVLVSLPRLAGERYSRCHLLLLN